MFSKDSYSPERLAHRAEILDRINLYFHAADRRRWRLMDFVFHDDATWRMSSVGGQGWRDTAKVCEDLFARSLLYTHHQMGNVLIRFEGNTAWVETYARAYHRVPRRRALGRSIRRNGLRIRHDWWPALLRPLRGAGRRVAHRHAGGCVRLASSAARCRRRPVHGAAGQPRPPRRPRLLNTRRVQPARSASSGRSASRTLTWPDPRQGRSGDGSRKRHWGGDRAPLC